MSLMLESEANNKNEHLEHQRLVSLINSMADAVIAVDESIKVVLYNGAALNILDINDLKPDSPITSVFKPIDKNNQVVDFKGMVRSATIPITNRDLRLEYSDGSFSNLYISIAPVHLGYGATGQKGFVILLRDITREKSLEEERDEFISVVSHELRTPITIAEGSLSNALMIAAKSDLPDMIKAALKQSHDQILFLADMINDLSTLSRAERDVLNVDIEPINISELINGLKKSYSPEAISKNLEIKVLIDPRLEILYSSQLYVKEIIQNFITNALKYTHEGYITIEAKVNPKGVDFIVSDTGIGISKADQERVFDKFFRSEDYRTRQANGTGLGLYVTMKLANLIHAQIELSSELDKGTSFSIFIPNLK